jgi:glyoxylase-like metal-dependent hydrolase (beta-lactamase superfamily II)
MAIHIQEFFDKNTSTLTYVVHDPQSRDAIVIDPVMDYDPASGRVWSESVHKVVAYIQENSLKPHFICETHVHADHLTGAPLLKKKYSHLKVAISENIKIVQETFQKIFNLPNFRPDGHQFEMLLKNNQVFSAGTLKIKVLHTPGHTPACLSYLIEDAVFTGDCIFMPDSGTGRCDFPNGSAETLFDSVVKQIYTLPDQTRIFVGHDYQPSGRALMFQTTVGEQKSKNIHIKTDTTKESFVQFRTARDKTLAAPRLLLPSIQVNMAGGELPVPEANGVSYLKMPLKIDIF